MITHLLLSKSLRALAGATCLATMSAMGVGYSADPLPPPVAKPVAISDVSLARAALAAIDADPVLKDVNLVVSVVDRVAVIGGPVNSPDVAKRAEQVVRSISGIEAVKNVCFVQADPDPLLRAVANRMKPGVKPTASAPLPGVAIPPGAPAGYMPPAPSEPPSDLLTLGHTSKTVVVHHPGSALNPAVGVLGAPTAPAAPGTASASPVVPAPASAPGTLTGTGPIPAAVANVRATDARFARLAVEQKPDGGLMVIGWVAKAEDAWDFAAALRKLPGVTRVAVDPALVK
jgi:BON domain